MIWRRIALHLKCLRFFSFVPLIVLFVISPLTFIPLLNHYGPSDALYSFLLEYTQTVFPFFSVWWIIFISREYIESDGNELLFVFKPRTLLREYLILFAAYLLCALVLYLLLLSVFPTALLEYFRLICICLVYFGISYVLMYTTSSVPLTVLITLAYSLMAMAVPSEQVNAVFYLSLRRFDGDILKTVCIPQLIIACVLIALGCFLNKKYVRYR